MTEEKEGEREGEKGKWNKIELQASMERLM